MDPAGNLHARPAGLSWDEPAWASGSHLDSVPHGGDYDGVTGVVVPLEIMRAAHQDGGPPPPLELIAFAEEEGPTFGLGMLGSRALVGALGVSELAGLINAEGLTYLAAGEPHGVIPAAIGQHRWPPNSLHGFIEVHAEQGPGMWKNGQAVALVTGIAGRFQYRVDIHGVANHAGSTSMGDRCDALAGAAEAMIRLEALAKVLSSQTVLTVGQMHVLPNAINVIPERVSFTIDFRSPDNAILERGQEKIGAILNEVCTARGLRLDFQQTEAIEAIALDSYLAKQVDAAARSLLGEGLPRTVSGALHDAAVVAPFLPTVMLFVASKDGISHNPSEFSRTEDIHTAALIFDRFLHENRFS